MIWLGKKSCRGLFFFCPEKYIMLLSPVSYCVMLVKRLKLWDVHQQMKKDCEGEDRI